MGALSTTATAALQHRGTDRHFRRPGSSGLSTAATAGLQHGPALMRSGPPSLRHLARRRSRRCRRTSSTRCRRLSLRRCPRRVSRGSMSPRCRPGRPVGAGAVRGLRLGTGRRTSTATIDALNTGQLAAFSAAGIAGLATATVAGLGTQVAAFTTAQMHALNSGPGCRPVDRRTAGAVGRPGRSGLVYRNRGVQHDADRGPVHGPDRRADDHPVAGAGNGARSPRCPPPRLVPWAARRSPA